MQQLAAVVFASVGVLPDVVGHSFVKLVISAEKWIIVAAVAVVWYDSVSQQRGRDADKVSLARVSYHQHRPT